MDVKPAVICLGPSGLDAARRATDILAGELFVKRGVAAAGQPFDAAVPLLRELFLAGRPLVGVCAAGILIRAVAPLLRDKTAEPPVISIADDGQTVTPLLGGHHGANDMARRLSPTDAITTAGDVRFGVALDEPPPGWRLTDPARAKAVMSRILAGAGVRIAGDAGWLEKLPKGNDLLISAGMTPAEPAADLAFHPQRAALGVGCSRDCPPGELAALVRETLSAANVSPLALAGVFTVDLKADEPAVLQVAASLDLPVRFFDPETLERETSRLATPSAVVYAEIGCHGVAEAAALAAAGDDAELIVTKRKTAHATCALARTSAPIIRLRGRKRGSVMLVSIGPGQATWRSPEASRMVARADELVGYGLYLDLLGPAAAGKPRRDFPLGGEEQRCRYALERAGAGADVALVCSGDAGIYAMGALVYELLDRSETDGGVSAAARRAEVISTPGISAFQAAAARAGAPVGHDFCVISLSDLLTPREVILKRLRAAAAGDFVIAFYNPVSRKRRELLDRAREILMEHRSADTPVLLAANLGRAAESLKFRTLQTLRTDDVDMLTLVLVGSSQTRRVDTPDGPRLFTPRGYAKRIDKHAKEEGA